MLTILAGVASLLINERKGEFLCFLTLLAVGAGSAVLLIYLWQTGESFVFSMGHFPAPWGNELRAGIFEALMATLVAVVMTLSLLAGRERIFTDILKARRGLYYLFCELLLCSLLAMIYTNDIFTAYVFIEINTLAACAIVVAKDTPETVFSTIRYLFMSLLGSGFFLLSIVFLYTITGYLSMPNILAEMNRLAVTGEYALPIIVIVLLISMSLAVKSALFPFHTWLPSEHGSATTASSAILSGIVLKGYVILLLKIFYRVFGLTFIHRLRVADVLFVFGLLGMIAGSIFAIRERDIKRMLAYSSVAQVGYIFMGIGLSTALGMVAACYHILAHAVTKPLLFCAADGLIDVSGHSKNIFEMKGAGRRNFLAGIGFMVGALSMVGIPLFSGFVSKFFFAVGSLGNPNKMIPTLMVLVLSTILNAMYYLPVLVTIYMGDPAARFHRTERIKNTKGYRLAMMAFVILNFVLGIHYSSIIRMIEHGLAML
jgi:multicomponent Na+:H+ antiporter subunit D